MMPQDLTELERSVLDKLLTGEHPVLEALRRQLCGCRVRKRELTGCGFFTELQVDRALPAAPTIAKKLRIGDVEAKITGLEQGAGFVLFVNNGYLDMLEGYSYDEPWPESVSEFELRYTGESRGVESLHLDS